MISGFTVAAVLASLGLAAPALASDDSGLAATELTGTVVPVQVEAGPGHGDEQLTLLQLADGQLTPITGIDGLAAGSTVRLTAVIPSTLEDDVEDQAGSTALDDARDQPASPASAVAAASTDAAAAQNVPLQTTSVQRVAPATAAANPAAQSLTIAAVGVGGYSASMFTDSVVSSMVSSSSGYWSGQSNGAITFSQAGSTTRYTSSIACSNASALWNEGVSKTGFVAGANKHLVLLLPLDAYSSGDCSYGLGTIGSSVSSGGQVYVSDTSWPALAHELGHNMSLWHANELGCGTSAYDSAFDSNGDPTASGCAVGEYGDGMDVMGASSSNRTGGLSSVGLLRLGLMPSAQRLAVTAAGATSATLIPLSSGPVAAGVRSVVVTDPRNSNVYYLENRQYAGQDTYGWHGLGNGTSGGKTTGYGLRVLRRGEDGASVLLDPTPSSPGAFDPDTVVKPGSAFLSASGGVQITTVQNNDGTVTATIDLAAAGQNHGSTGTDPGTGNDPSDPSDPDDRAATQTALTAPARMLAGTQYTISGTVRGTAAGTGTPTGSVSLQIGDDVRDVPLTGGAFSATYTPLTPGELDIHADYAGGTGFDESGDALTVTVLSEKSDAAIAVTAPAVSATASSARADIAVTADGAAATGTVRVLDEDGLDVGGGTLNTSGLVRVSLPVPAPGKHAWSVVYSGDETVDDGTGAFSLNVGKYTSKVQTKLARSTITRKQSTYVTVVVLSAGDDPATGVVRLIGSRNGVLSSAKLSRGKAKLAVPKSLSTGKQVLRVAYYGSATVNTSVSASTTLRVTS